MPNKLIAMQTIRLIIHYLLRGFSLRKIAETIKMSRVTVTQYVERLRATSLSLDHLHGLADADLSVIVYPTGEKPTSDPRKVDLDGRLTYFQAELSRRGVTRRLLWDEYIAEVPQGYSYTQFCVWLSRSLKQSDASMHFEYPPADVMLVDFAGAKLSYHDRDSDTMVQCPVLVCVLPFSGLSYVAALPNASQPHLIKALNDCLEFFGGVPLNFKTDNMKQVVSKSCRYEPVFTDLMEQWALHNRITLKAARVRKPKDKAPVEAEVKRSYQKIYAPLRNEVFYSLSELNEAIMNKLHTYHRRTFQQKNTNRFAQFIDLEKPFLQALPESPFVIRKSFQFTVQKNYHIQLNEDTHQYSTPFTLIGKRVKVIYDTTTVEIFHKHQRIALHPRNYKKNGFSTILEHMPQSHQLYTAQKGWDHEVFLLRAEKIGKYTREYVGHMLKGKNRSEQTQNACLGLFRLGKAYGEQRLETACKRALRGLTYNFRTIQSILAANLDKLETDHKPVLFSLPKHKNIRGPKAFE